MKVEEIIDEGFDKLIYKATNRPNSPRRFEIHFSDLLGSLIISYYRKMFPQTYTKKDSRRLQGWFRGKGHEIGHVNALSVFLPKSQKVTKCGKAFGSIDMELFEEIYEITTTVFPYRKSKKYPHIGKAKQLMQYIASEDKEYGKLVVFFEIPDYQGRYKRTWKISLSPSQRKNLRRIIKKNSYLLWHALETGKWKILPRTELRWAMKDEQAVVEWMEDNSDLVRKAHKEWLQSRSESLKTKQNRIWVIKLQSNGFPVIVKAPECNLKELGFMKDLMQALIKNKKRPESDNDFKHFLLGWEKHITNMNLNCER